MKRLFFFIVGVLLSLSLFSQNRYWVFFTDKSGVSFNPYEYFDAKAIQRRLKCGLSLYDSTDFPVKREYIEQVAKIVDSVNVVTRWFNGVSVIADGDEIQKVSELPFVKDFQPILLSTYPAGKSFYTDSQIFELAHRQLEIMQGQAFAKEGITGKGVRIAVFDAGFPGVDKNPIFKHLRDNHQILKTYDFAKKKEFVYKYNHHGTMVLSCIAGQLDTVRFGLATDAEFLLARTEVNTEPFSEEENWLAAAEWADKNGADIISSSLGYTLPRYFQYQMDGKTSLVAQAAQKASEKGILVVNAMGNDGSSKWKVVGTPADAPGVLSVGGVDPDTKVHINFSSYGPTASGLLKPEVCASGKAAVATPEKYTIAYGTSFATPLTTGFAACVLQTDTSLTGQELKHRIITCASLYPYYDYAHGYGIPQAENILHPSKRPVVPTFDVNIKNLGDEFYISVDFKSDLNDYFFYEFMDKSGKINEYWVDYQTSKHFSISRPKIEKTEIFRAFYKGYVFEQELK